MFVSSYFGPRYMIPIFSNFVLLWIEDFIHGWVRRSGCPEIGDSDGQRSSVHREKWVWTGGFCVCWNKVNENNRFSKNQLHFWEDSVPLSLKVLIAYLWKSWCAWRSGQLISHFLTLEAGSVASWEEVPGSCSFPEWIKQPPQEEEVLGKRSEKSVNGTRADFTLRKEKVLFERVEAVDWYFYDSELYQKWCRIYSSIHHPPTHSSIIHVSINLFIHRFPSVLPSTWCALLCPLSHRICRIRWLCALCLALGNNTQCLNIVRHTSAFLTLC